MLVEMYSHARLGGRHRGIIWRYKGPFLILKKVGAQPYKVELSPKIKYCPLFHICLLKSFHGDQMDQSEGISQWTSMDILIQHDKKVEFWPIEWYGILSNHRHMNSLSRGKDFPKMKLVGSPSNIYGKFKEQIRAYEDKKAMRTLPEEVEENVMDKSPILDK